MSARSIAKKRERKKRQRAELNAANGTTCWAQRETQRRYKEYKDRRRRERR